MDIFTDKHSGLQFCIKTGTTLGSDIVSNGIQEYSLIKWCEQFLTSQGIFVDVGAHMGTYSILLQKKCKEVYTFEPQRSTFDCLSIGICVNNGFNIKSHNIALGSKHRSGTLYHTSEDGYYSTLRPKILHNLGLPIMREEVVTVETLDSFGLKNVDFLKIDAQGSELEVIKGALITLASSNFPPFIFEAFSTEWYKQDRELLLSFVRNLGYIVCPVSGYSNMYLAADHPLHPKKEALPKQEPVEEVKYDIKGLCHKFESGELDGAQDDLSWQEWHAISKHYRLESKHLLSFKSVHRGLKASPPEDSKYLLYEELSIVSFYINKKEEGVESCENVILSATAPWTTRNTAISNEGYYMKGLEIKKKINITYEMPKHYTPSTASIKKNKEDGYRINLRGINYYLSDKGYGVSRHGDNIIRTINYILDTDKSFKVQRAVEVKDNSGVTVYPKNVLGMEDIRLFGDNYFFCTYLEVNEPRTPQICWGTYDESGSVTRIVPLMAGTELKCEKNWLPFIDNDEIYIIYAIGPLQIYKLDKETGSVKEVKYRSTDDFYIKDFRGSASPIQYKDGWLCTIHQVYHSEPRKYFHRFIWFDRDFTTMKLSLPFFFDSVAVEFNLSICDSGDDFLLTYSHNDASSTIAVVDYGVVDSMLKYLECHLCPDSKEVDEDTSDEVSEKVIDEEMVEAIDNITNAVNDVLKNI